MNFFASQRINFCPLETPEPHWKAGSRQWLFLRVECIPESPGTWGFCGADLEEPRREGQLWGGWDLVLPPGWALAASPPWLSSPGTLLSRSPQSALASTVLWPPVLVENPEWQDSHKQDQVPRDQKYVISGRNHCHKWKKRSQESLSEKNLVKKQVRLGSENKGFWREQLWSKQEQGRRYGLSRLRGGDEDAQAGATGSCRPE